MPTLKEVAQRANVSLLTTYHVLSNTGSGQIAEDTRQAVLDVAANLGYRLNVTIHDVAALAEVSIATDSYVLNNTVQVSAPTGKRVLNAVSDLIYHPNITVMNFFVIVIRFIWYAST